VIILGQGLRKLQQGQVKRSTHSTIAINLCMLPRLLKHFQRLRKIHRHHSKKYKGRQLGHSKCTHQNQHLTIEEQM
jgi:hypothetical protein